MTPKKGAPQWRDETPEEILARCKDDAERAVVAKYLRGDIAEPARKEAFGGKDMVGKDRRKFRRAAIPQTFVGVAPEDRQAIVKHTIKEREERDRKLEAAGFAPKWKQAARARRQLKETA